MSERTETIVNPLDPGNDSHSVETAAADFSAMLAEEGKRPRRERASEPAAQSPAEADDAGTGEPERQPQGERGEAEDGEDRDPILDGDDAEDADQDDAEDGEDQDADDDDAGDDDDGEDPLDAKHEITVNGEKLEITVREALAGYQRDSDYRQKTERNAREYDEIRQFAADTVQRRQNADQTLQFGLALIQSLQPSQEDWDAMEKSDPQGFINAQKHWTGILAKAREIVAAQNTLADDSSAEGTADRARYFETQERELMARFPALKDAKKANSFRQAVMEYGRKIGYSDEELVNGATDHRDLATLYYASQYLRIRDSKQAAGKKAGQKAPRTSEESRPRNPGRSAKSNALRNADRRLQRTGSVQDAATSFAEMIRGGG